MLKVVIADDENIVRLGLSTLINWEKHGYELVGLFSNGKDALDYCALHSPDILLTDVKMPIMDGIQLIRELQKVLPGLKTIVLSNYSDFDLVSGSYKTGAIDYLLKQFLEPDKLLQALDHARTKILAERGIEVEASLGGRTEQNQALLWKLLHGVEATGLNEQAAYLLSGIGFGCYLCVFCKFTKPEGGGYACYKGAYPSFETLNRQVLQAMHKYGRAESIILDSSILAIFSMVGVSPQDRPVESVMKDLATDLSCTLQSLFDLRIYMGYSRLQTDFSGASIARAEAQAAVERSFFMPEKVLFAPSDSTQPSSEWEITDPLIRDLRRAVLFSRLDVLAQRIDRFFDVDAIRMGNPPAVRQACLRILTEIEYALKERLSVELIGSEDRLAASSYEAVMDCQNIWELRDILTCVVERLAHALLQLGDQRSVISDAKAFLQQHHQENIGLKDVAKHLNMNSNYLSQIFKERTGENFSTYLSRCRIEKAVELMNRERLSTEEVAEMVGYYNPNYFIKVFKKITGMTFSEFKRQTDIKRH